MSLFSGIKWYRGSSVVESGKRFQPAISALATCEHVHQNEKATTRPSSRAVAGVVGVVGPPITFSLRPAILPQATNVALRVI